MPSGSAEAFVQRVATMPLLCPRHLWLLCGAADKGAGMGRGSGPRKGRRAPGPPHTPFMLAMPAGIALHRVSGARGKPWPAAPA